MDDMKRMAAVLLVLILIIANLAVAIAEQFLEDDKSMREAAAETAVSTAVSESTAEASASAAVSGTETSGAVQTDVSQTSEPSAGTAGVSQETPEAKPGSSVRKVKKSEHRSVIPAAEFRDASEAQSILNIEGALEGLVDKNVFQVTLPVGSTVIEYIADPQGLISHTSHAAYPDSYFDPGSNVYFDHGAVMNEEGRELEYYSGISEPFTVVNKSSCAVSVVARISAHYRNTSAVPVTLFENNSWDGISRPGIFLSAMRGDDFTETAVTKKEQVMTASIKGCPGAYCYRYDGNGYVYELMSDDELAEFRADSSNKGVDTAFKEFSLMLKGECNGEGEWDPYTEYDFPTVSIIWNVGFAASARPCITETSVSVARDEKNIINYSMGLLDSAASMIMSAMYITPENVERELRWNDYYLKFDEQEITLTPEFAGYVRERNGGILRFRFDDPEKSVYEVSLDLDAPPDIETKEVTVTLGENKPVTVPYYPGFGEKAAEGVSKISFGNKDFSTKVYSSVNEEGITFTAGAVRSITDKNGGTVYITFDDPAHTKCAVRFKVKK